MLKKEKGITLISLVITIILLLILATVAISLAVDSNGLFSRAGDTANNWNTSVAEEEGTLQNLLDMADKVGTKKITFYLVAGGTNYEFTVDSGTTWEQFIKTQKPADGSGTQFFADPIVLTNGTSFGGVTAGVLVVQAGGPVYEGEFSEGKWAFPTDVPSDGAYYKTGR